MKSKARTVLEYAVDRGYSVTTDGEVISFTGKTLTKGVANNGYYEISIRTDRLFNDRSSYKVKVHQLVALLKYGDEYHHDLHVRHLDGDPKNNSYQNIAIGTASDNMMDKDESVRLRTAMKATTAARKYDGELLDSIKKDRESGMSYNALNKKYGISKGTLSYMFNSSLYYNEPEKYAALA